MQPLAWRPWLVGVIAAVVFLPNLGGSHLWDDDEPKNARCGVEMWQNGEWVVPQFNAELRDHKPVLLYWAMIASYSVLGVSEFAARLPSAIAGVAVAVMCHHLGRLLFDRTTGLLAALLLSSALMFVILARASTPDAVLMVGTTAALLAFVAGVAHRRGGHFSGRVGESAPPLASIQLPWRYGVAMYAAMGWAVLAKGPIGLVMPLLAIVSYGLFGEPAGVERRAGESRVWYTLRWFVGSVAPGRWASGSRSIRLLAGLAIVAVVAGPWYVAVSFKTEGAWLAGFLGTHNVGRFAGAMEGHDGRPFYALYYVVSVLVGFFPASCFLPVGLVGAVRKRNLGGRLAPSYAFAACYVIAWLGFFSLAATKLPNYVAPCYVGLALVTAAWLAATVRQLEAAELATWRSWLGAGMASCVASGVVAGLGLGYVGAVLMGDAAWIGLVGLFPAAGGFAGLWLASRGEPRPAVAAFVVCGLAFTIVGVTLVGPAASPHADGPRIADRIRTIEQATGEPVEFATFHYTVPTLVWELDRPVPRVEPDALVDRLRGEGSYVVMPRNKYEEVAATLPPGVTELGSETRFLRPGVEVVLVGRQPSLAGRATSSIK